MNETNTATKTTDKTDTGGNVAEQRVVINPERLIGDWIDEKCPRCSARLLGNLDGDKWCSFINCTYGCEDDYAALGL